MFFVKTALIQLISEQTMQNLLPVLALKPDKVFHLSTPKMSARSPNIVEAAKKARVDTVLDDFYLSEMPRINEVSEAVMQSIDQARNLGLNPVVNFTGGTKLMSIGAYEAAMREQVSSLYVDTDHREFLDGGTGGKLKTLLGDNLGFEPIQKDLTLDVIGLANGGKKINGGGNWKSFLALAQYLFDSPDVEDQVWDAIHGKQGLCPGGKEPRDASNWLELLNININLPGSVGELALKAGIICKVGSVFRLPQETRHSLETLAKEKIGNYFSAIRPLQFSLAFLSGAWWEVVVADAAERCQRFNDLRWSVNVSGSQNSAVREEDIIGLDGVQVAYFSCKRGGQKQRLLSQLDELNNRAQSIGGRFTRRFLAVYKHLAEKPAAELQRRASEMGVKIIKPEDLNNPSFFAEG